MVATAKTTHLDVLTPILRGIADGLEAFWPVLILVGLIAVARLAFRIYQVRRLARSGIEQIDRMDGQTFEHFVGTVFRRLGYSVEITKYQGDYGADLVVRKDRVRTAVQAKRWSKRVGIRAVQEAVAAKGLYGCDEALVIANRDFTQQARRLAKANKVALWDRSVLVDKLLVAQDSDVTSASSQPEPVSSEKTATLPIPEEDVTAVAPAERASAGDDPPSCELCGVAVSIKVRDYCLSHPTRFGGRIYCFKHQRGVADVLRKAE